MKLILDFKTKDKYIPKNYRSFILSFFKYTLKEYNSDIYEKYYSDKYHVKDFCFSIYLKNAIFNKDRISIDNSIGLTISILNFADAVDFYNALSHILVTGKKKNKIFNNIVRTHLSDEHNGQLFQISE